MTPSDSATQPATSLPWWFSRETSLLHNGCQGPGDKGACGPSHLGWSPDRISSLAEASGLLPSCSEAPLSWPLFQNHPKASQRAPASRRMKRKLGQSFEAAIMLPRSSSLLRTSPEGEDTKRICDEQAGGSLGPGLYQQFNSLPSCQR